MEVHSIFPTPVYENNINRTFSNIELEYIKECEKHFNKNAGNITSAETYVLNKKPMKNIKLFLENCINEYISLVVIPKFDVDIRITQSWLNFTRPGEFHHKHSHPNSFISGVLYISADPEKDRIIFYNKNFNMYILNVPPIDDHDYNCNSMWFSSKPGKLLIFPSTLEHSVPVTTSEETRISLSFNTFLTGNIGDDRTLTGLRI